MAATLTDAPNSSDNPAVSPPNESHQPHSDKFNDPRAKFSGKSWAAVFGVFVFAILFASASIYLRRTRLEKTTEFWGEATITAVQLGDHVMLLPREGSDFKPVELTAFPGLGHLRKAILDERHYEWETEAPQSVSSLCEQFDERQCVRLEFSDPTFQRFGTAVIDIELRRGILGPADRPRSVRFNSRVRPALQHQIGLLMRVEQKRYDQRP